MTKEKITELRNNVYSLFQEKFGNIIFEEGSHRYTIDGEEYTPVSTIISQYENPFDVELRSATYAQKHGMEQNDVKKMWKYKNLSSTIMGTRTHEFGESYTNLMCGRAELMCEQNKAQYVKNENWLIPTYTQEFAIKDFYDKLHPSLYPMCAEAKLSTYHIDGARKICGTADLLFYYDAPDNSSKSGFVVMDWKTNTSLVNSFARDTNLMMRPPFEDYYDEALSHYYLQFNLYQRMMESVGLNVIARRLIHLKHEGGYEIYNIPKINDNVIDSVMYGK